MNKDIAQKWVDALRSGKYTQGSGRLRYLTEDGPRDCCIGVLCEVAIQEGLPIVTCVDDQNDVLYDDQRLGPPESVIAWSQIEHESTERYIDMNDVDHRNFLQIANAIERDNNLKGGE